MLTSIPSHFCVAEYSTFSSTCPSNHQGLLHSCIYTPQWLQAEVTFRGRWKVTEDHCLRTGSERCLSRSFYGFGFVRDRVPISHHHSLCIVRRRVQLLLSDEVSSASFSTDAFWGLFPKQNAELKSPAAAAVFVLVHQRFFPTALGSRWRAEYCVHYQWAKRWRGSSSRSWYLEAAIHDIAPSAPYFIGLRVFP